MFKSYKCVGLGWKSLKAPLLWTPLCGANNAACSDIFYKCSGEERDWVGYIRKLTIQSFPVLVHPTNCQHQEQCWCSPKRKPCPNSFSACWWQWHPPSSGRTMRPTPPTTTATTTATTGPPTTPSRATSTPASGERRQCCSHPKTGKGSQPGKFQGKRETFELVLELWAPQLTGGTMIWSNFKELSLLQNKTSPHRTSRACQNNFRGKFPANKWQNSTKCINLTKANQTCQFVDVFNRY